MNYFQSLRDLLSWRPGDFALLANSGLNSVARRCLSMTIYASLEMTDSAARSVTSLKNQV